jgi:hypothetical protein
VHRRRRSRHDVVVRFRPFAASGLSVPRRGASHRTSCGRCTPLRAGVLPRSTPGNNSPRSAITTAARRCRPRTPRSHRPAALPPRSGIGGRAGGSPGGPTDLPDRLRRAVAARREALPDVDGRSLSSCITGPAADTSVTSSVTSGCRPAAPRSCHSLAARSPYRQLFDGRLKPNWKSYRLGSRDSRRAASWWLRLRSGSSTVSAAVVVLWIEIARLRAVRAVQGNHSEAWRRRTGETLSASSGACAIEAQTSPN